MTKREMQKLEHKLDAYIESLVVDLGREERRRALKWYAMGLLLDGERKSIEPMAGRLVENDSDRDAMRQRLQQAITNADWSEAEAFRRLALKLQQQLPQIEAFIIDDTGFPKKGTHSVGVARQYSGTLGRTDNCQVAPSLHLAGALGSACIRMRLYLPEEWTSDPERCRAAGIPETICFRKKWEIALDLLDEALQWELPKYPVLADSGYGDCNEFRQGLRARDLNYLVEVKGTTVVWEPGTGPIPPQPRGPGEFGRPRTKYTDGDQPPLSLSELAFKLGRSAYRKVTWRDGLRGKRTSRFAALRIRTAHGHGLGKPPGEEEWLLCEWPENEPEPTKFYLSTLPANSSLKRLVYFAKLRWRVERDYQEMKGELGLDHFEGRRWRGFHHHVALCAIAHGFLTLERARFFLRKRPKTEPEPGPFPKSEESFNRFY